MEPHCFYKTSNATTTDIRLHILVHVTFSTGIFPEKIREIFAQDRMHDGHVIFVNVQIATELLQV